MIEFIDTKKSLTNIIDMNIENLFLGNKQITHIHHRLLNDVDLSQFYPYLESELKINQKLISHLSNID